MTVRKAGHARGRVKKEAGLVTIPCDKLQV